MRCIATVTLTNVGTNGETVNLSTYNYTPTSTEDYFLIINSGRCGISQQSSNQAWGDGVKIANKTTTSFTISSTDNTMNFVTVQIIALK